MKCHNDPSYSFAQGKEKLAKSKEGLRLLLWRSPKSEVGCPCFMPFKERSVEIRTPGLFLLESISTIGILSYHLASNMESYSQKKGKLIC